MSLWGEAYTKSTTLKLEQAKFPVSNDIGAGIAQRGPIRAWFDEADVTDTWYEEVSTGAPARRGKRSISSNRVFPVSSKFGASSALPRKLMVQIDEIGATNTRYEAALATLPTRRVSRSSRNKKFLSVQALTAPVSRCSGS
jgi:hypothetical protein